MTGTVGVVANSEKIFPVERRHHCRLSDTSSYRPASYRFFETTGIIGYGAPSFLRQELGSELENLCGEENGLGEEEEEEEEEEEVEEEDEDNDREHLQKHQNWPSLLLVGSLKPLLLCC
jgi:hypothetical protein